MATVPTLRGPQDPLIASCSYPPDLRPFIKRAMMEGDMLPNPVDIVPARRRALIIAPQYKEPGQTFPPLPTTAADVKLIYDLLVRSGYEPRNIRILCDVWSFNGRVHPTRENILGMARCWDNRRRLSFPTLQVPVTYHSERSLTGRTVSGHGQRVETDSSKGKVGRVVRSDNWPRMPGAWDSELSLDAIQAGRVFEQTIVESELVYYNEAIITRICEGSDLEYEGEEDPEPADKVWDRELNAYLSKLPEGSTITCIMDCCASGRILNLSRKLQGSGFRGKPAQAASSNLPLIPSFPTSFSSPDTASGPSTSGLVSPTISSMATIASTVVNIIPHMVRYARTAMQEGIPERERHMDGIQARVFAWSACHQRQQSWDSNDCSNGLLTLTFTETCIRLGGTLDSPTRYTYNALFEAVSKLVAEMRATSPNPAPQFVQLWTSLREENRAVETNLLDSHVEF